jgi:hypothetical protein
MITMKKLIPLALPLWMMTLIVHAQSYSIDWDVIAGGGGLTTGGGYSANSTMGEHVAGGSLAGGTYSLASGFWVLYAVATPGAPLLTIQVSPTNGVVLAWPVSSTGWTLQQNSDLVSGPWITLTNTVNTVSGQNQVILPPPSGNRFYRLQSH